MHLFHTLTHSTDITLYAHCELSDITQTCRPSLTFVDYFRSVLFRHVSDFVARALHSFASLSLLLSLFPPSLYYTHKHCNVYQVTLLYDVSSWTCCFSGGQSFANPHPSHPKERRCWKTWWPSMSCWETSTLITALQVFSCQLAKPHTFTCEITISQEIKYLHFSHLSFITCDV